MQSGWQPTTHEATFADECAERLETNDPLESATGYSELGMFLDAWDLIESIPPEEKTKAPTLDLRLQILTALSQWDLGEHLAELLLYAGESESKTVARFHYARARAFYEMGEYQKARESLKALSALE
ncbi:hypothetical protein N9B73_13690 [Verrucomicrobiales bacterium]|nr:hypothetical protein [Verrucomicrobiales bacterium]